MPQQSVQCPHCDQIGHWPSHQPLPSKIRCPSCRKVFQPANVSVPDSKANSAIGTNTARQSVSLTNFESVVYPREPWYYRYLHTLGIILQVLCMLGLVGALILFTIGACSSMYFVFAEGGGSIGEFFALFLGWAVYLGFSLAVSFASFFWAAWLLLMVDVARNLRWQRLILEHNLENRSSHNS